MKRRRTIFMVLIYFLILSLAACSLPAPAIPESTDDPAAFTQAAETIIAHLTQLVDGFTPTPPSGETPEGPLPGTPPAETTAPAETLPSPTSTETATTEPSPTLVPTPTPTLAPADPRVSLGNPQFHDTFESGTNWALYEDDHVAFEVKEGELILTAFETDQWDGWMLTWPTGKDFYLEMTATQENCAGLDRYGLVARQIQTDLGYIGYLFGVSCDGRYSLRSWDGKTFTTLINWTANENLNTGSHQTNRIGWMAQGDRLSFYANGHHMVEYRDATHQEGRFGVFIGAANTPDFTVAIGEVAYWELP